MPLVTVSGFEDMYGRSMRMCPHMAEWFKVFNDYCIFRGHIKRSLDVWQAFGDAKASAGTHAGGDCIDVSQSTDAFIADAREAGARASWARITRYGWNGDQHSHLKLVCPCVTNATYQVDAVDAGFNGLGWNGRGGKDYHARPKVRRDYKAGIAWMKSRMPKDEDVIVAITSASKADFKALLLDALRDKDVAVALGRAALGNTYGDHNGDGKSDTAGQVLGIVAGKLDEVTVRLDAALDKLGAK